MKPISLKVPLADADKIKDFFKKQGFKDKKVQHTLWSLSDGKTHLNLYKTGSLLIQGQKAEFYKDRILELIDEPGSIVAGCDESGKGDVFGGLVVCCAVIEPDTYKKVLSVSPKDSKKLKDKEIFERVKALSGLVRVKCITLSPESYNAMYKKRPNINDILTVLYRKLIKEVTNRFSPREIVVDRYSGQEVFSDLPSVKFLYKAESLPAVAVASIFARYKFLKQLEKLGSGAGFELPKGASREAMNKAIEVFSRDRNLAERLVKLNFLMGAGGLEPPTGRL